MRPPWEVDRIGVGTQVYSFAAQRVISIGVSYIGEALGILGEG